MSSKFSSLLLFFALKEVRSEMDINSYVLLTYAMTAVISFFVIGVVVVINKIMNGKNSQDSSQ